MKTPTTVTLEVWYTDAPVDYDYATTINLGGTGHFPYRDRELRKVLIPPTKAEYQLPRYGSGMYCTLTEEELKDLLR
jgi:hypothetical protein